MEATSFTIEPALVAVVMGTTVPNDCNVFLPSMMRPSGNVKAGRDGSDVLLVVVSDTLVVVVAVVVVVAAVAVEFDWIA